MAAFRICNNEADTKQYLGESYCLTVKGLCAQPPHNLFTFKNDYGC